jgi:hypothetical protein
MFLDEELLEIGRNTGLTEDCINKSISKMVKVCFANLEKNLPKRSSDEMVISQFKRVNNTWKAVARILDHECLGFVKEDGFQLYVESKEEFTFLKSVFKQG